MDEALDSKLQLKACPPYSRKQSTDFIITWQPICH